MIPQRRQQTAQTDIGVAERKTRRGAHAVLNSTVDVTGHLSFDFKLNSIERKIH